MRSKPVVLLGRLGDNLQLSLMLIVFNGSVERDKFV